MELFLKNKILMYDLRKLTESKNSGV